MNNKQGHSMWRKMITGLAAFALGVSVTGLTMADQASAADPTPVKVVGNFLTCADDATSDCYLQTTDGGATYSGSFTVPEGEYYFHLVHNGLKIGATPSDAPQASGPGENGAVNVPRWVDGTDGLSAIDSYFYVSSEMPVTFNYNSSTHRYSVTSASDPVYTVLGGMQRDIPIPEDSPVYEACQHSIANDQTRHMNEQERVNADWRPACMNMMLTNVGGNLWVWAGYGIEGGYDRKLKIVEGLSWYTNWGDLLGGSTFRGEAKDNDMTINQPVWPTPGDSNPASQQQYTEIIFGPTNGTVTCPGLNTTNLSGNCGSQSTAPNYGTVINTYSSFDDAFLDGKNNSLVANGTAFYTLTFSADEIEDSLGTSQFIDSLTAANIILTNPYEELTVTDNWVKSVINQADGTIGFKVQASTLVPGLYKLEMAATGVPSSPGVPVPLYQPMLRFTGTYTAHLTVDVDNNPVNGQTANRLSVSATDDTLGTPGTTLLNRDVIITVPSGVTVYPAGGSTALTVTDGKVTVNTGPTGTVQIDVKSTNTAATEPVQVTFEATPGLTTAEDARNQECLAAFADLGDCYIRTPASAPMTFDRRVPKVTYWANNEVTPEATKDGGGFAVGSPVTVESNTFTKAGSSFDKWTTNRDGSGTTYQPGGTFTMPNADVDLYAQWKLSLSVNYDTKGGTPAVVTDSTDYYNGDVATVSSVVVTRDGYEFAGWNDRDVTDPDPAVVYDAGDQITMTRNVYLDALWNPILSYDINGGQGTTPASAAHQENASVTVAAASQFSRTGYEFTGWTMAQNGSGTKYAAASTLAMPATPTTLYAQWDPILSYNLNGGQGTTPASAAHPAGDPVTVAAAGADFAMTVDGRTWVFTDWNTAAGGVTDGGTTYAASSSLTMPDAPTTLWAQWEPLYKLTYWANDGSQANQAGGEHKAGASLTVAQNSFTRTGYEFVGWNTLADRTATGAREYLPASALTIANADVDLYAQWNPLLSYDLNGGQGTTPASAYHQAGANVTVAAAGADFTMTVNGRTYVFDTWSTTPSGTGTSYAPQSALTMPNAPTTLYARWLPLWVLDYNAGDGGVGTVPQGGTYLEGASVTVASPSGLSKPNHSFGGWSDTSGSVFAPADALTMPGHDETLTALWVPDQQYPVSYNANGGTGPVPPTASYYAAAQVTVSARSAELVNTHHTFDSWNTAANGSGTRYVAGNTFDMPAAAVVLYAQWVLDPTYTLSYDTDGGAPATIPTQEGYFAGDQATVSSTAVTKAGYSFANWKDLATGATYQPAGSVPIIDRDVTVTAQWTPLPGAISLQKVASRGSVDAQGQEVTYTFNVTNTGPVALRDVAINDPMLSGVTCPSTVTIPLAPEASMQCSGTYQVSLTDINRAAPLVNTATVVGTPVNGQPQVSATARATVNVSRLPALQVTKGVDAAEAHIGDQLTYTVTIKNTGNTTLRYSYTDTFNGKGAWDKKVARCVDPATSRELSLNAESAVLAPGQTAVCTMTPYTVVEADLPLGELFNVVLVHGVTVDGPEDPVDAPAESPKTKLIPPVEVTTGGTVLSPGVPYVALVLIAAGVALAGGLQTRRAVLAKR